MVLDRIFKVCQVKDQGLCAVPVVILIQFIAQIKIAVILIQPALMGIPPVAVGNTGNQNRVGFVGNVYDDNLIVGTAVAVTPKINFLPHMGSVSGPL